MSDPASTREAGAAMSPVSHAVRLGLIRGWIEFRQTITDRDQVIWTVIMNGIYVTVLFFQRDSAMAGGSVTLAALTLPSLLGVGVAFGGWVGTASLLALEREDGTLLRAKAVPHGMVGYLLARVISTSLVVVFGLLVTAAVGLLLVDGLLVTGIAGLWTLLWVLVLGLLATASWGAILGSSVKNPSAGFGLVFLPASGLVAISGIFYPITALPGWVQAIAQAFPIYWLGLGMRAGLLPDAAAAAEIGQAWRLPWVAGVVGAWAIAGLLIAPGVLRRMARRESGSAMEERKQRALQRVS
jgi:ABC-2 type transport system permease protein